MFENCDAKVLCFPFKKETKRKEGAALDAETTHPNTNRFLQLVALAHHRVIHHLQISPEPRSHSDTSEAEMTCGSALITDELDATLFNLPSSGL
jgi:hypothetical protein